jgi:hypothetical protein
LPIDAEYDGCEHGARVCATILARHPVRVLPAFLRPRSCRFLPGTTSTQGLQSVVGPRRLTAAGWPVHRKLRRQSWNKRAQSHTARRNLSRNVHGRRHCHRRVAAVHGPRHIHGAGSAAASPFVATVIETTAGKVYVYPGAISDQAHLAGRRNYYNVPGLI